MANSLVFAFILASTASAGKLGNFLEQHLGFAHHSDGLVRSLEFKHQLRVCNAYPYAERLDVYRGEKEKLTGAPMAYKSCQDFKGPLKAGDKLDFKVGQASAGSFSVADLPENDAVLLLVVSRHDSQSTAVSFQSHVFANMESAQVAIIDTFKGKERATPRIRDHGKNHTKSEELRYDSVVAVNPGQYDLVLDDAVGKEVAKSSLVALQHESYVVFRTGVDAKKGESFPEEIVVFPQSDAAALPHSDSGAARVSAASGLLMLAAFVMA